MLQTYVSFLQDQSRSIIALDGNFGLVHKKRGDGVVRARHQNLFFFDDKVVQDFNNKWGSNSARDADVSKLSIV